MMQFFLIRSDPNNQLMTHYILAQEYAFTCIISMSLLLQSPKRWLANSSSMVEKKICKLKEKLTLT